MNKLWTLIVALSLTAVAYAQNYSKILMLGTPTSVEMQTGDSRVDDDELAAYRWFIAHDGATYASAADLASGSVNLSDYTAVWIILDRQIAESTPEGFVQKLKSNNDALFSNSAIQALTQYYKSGGNLLLTNHASVLLKEVGRYANYPYSLGSFGSGNGASNGDTWYARVSYMNLDPVNDKSTDPIYNGIQMETFEGYKRFPLIDDGWKEDHNCFFNLDVSNNNNGDTGKYTKLANEFGVEYLAVWPHIGDICSAAITRWNAFGQYKGKAIAIGFGGYEWNQNDGDNRYRNNIETLTVNALKELTGDNTPVTPPVVDPDPDQPAGLLLHYDMDKNGNTVRETVSGRDYEIRGHFSEAMPGAVNNGTALRTDAYSTYVEGDRINYSGDLKQMTVDLWCAAETYPMGTVDREEEGWGAIAGNQQDGNGWVWEVSSRGGYRFVVSINGQDYLVQAQGALPKYQWNHLVASVDSQSGKIKLYNNGTEVANANCPTGNITLGNGTMIIGKSRHSAEFIGCFVNSFNGLIDDISVYSGTSMVATLNAIQPQGDAEVIVNPIRYADNKLRPQFHAAPGANWGNEMHGLYYDKNTGKYHAFYQKNANGQYLSRMHWGHLVSDDLMEWHEVKTAVDPLEGYEWKGCWSGCVFQDDDFNNGKPTIFYTGVNNTDPGIIQALPVDDDLLNWEKSHTGISRPASGYDFRDPYVFKHNGNYYMVIGRELNGHGAMSLHVYDRNSKSWSVSPATFFEATGEGSFAQGSFWEMPTVTWMGDRWLVTVVSCAVADNDVRTLYWTGQLQGEGNNLRFVPDQRAPRTVEMSGLSGYGYGLLSPSLLKKDGRLIAIGIVPDKLPAEHNINNGWSHIYSLPREWTLVDGELVQKPLTELSALRAKEGLDCANCNEIPATFSLADGRMLEIEMEVDAASQGRYRLQFFDDGNGCADFTLDMRNKQVSVNYGGMPRLPFDSGVFSSSFVHNFGSGTRAVEDGNVRLHVYVDHSVVDMFLNDKYAASMRIYPTGTSDMNLHFYSENDNNNLRSFKASALSLANRDLQTAVSSILQNSPVSLYVANNALYVESADNDAQVTIYTMTGLPVWRATVSNGSIHHLPLPTGMYIAVARIGVSELSQKLIVK